MGEVQGGTRHLARPLRLAGKFVRRTWQVLVVAVLAIALGVAAYLSPGLIQADVHLNEGTVYAGNRNLALLGTVNAQIDQISDATLAGETKFRILQHEDLVLMHSTHSDRLARYNPGSNKLSAPTQLPAQSRVQLVGDQLLVVNPVDGRAWFGAATELLDYDFDKERADLEIGENGTATLTTSGAVIGLDPNSDELVRPSASGNEFVELPFDVEPMSVELSAVGERAVVLDRASGRIWLEGMAKAFDVSGASGAQLMAPAPDALRGEKGARAIYATQAGLIAVTNDGPTSLSGPMDATPITPIQVGDCVYAAFGHRFVRSCVGRDVHIEDIPSYPANAELAFGANRSTVALNDLAGGNVWLVDKGMTLVNNWQDVVPEQTDVDENDPDVQTFLPPDRDKENRPPIAADDSLAARAGRSTVLTVLDNDTDPDADVMTISAPAELNGARLSPVRNGAGLQISIDPAATGTLTFTYEISDGRGGTDTATVTVRILPLDASIENSLPYKSEFSQDLKISQRQILTKQILLDWRDPDGDPLMLTQAWLDEDSEDRVAFTSDGTLTFTDVGKTTGVKKVHLRISDGFGVKEGELLLNVSAEPVAPTAYGDFATTTVGEPVEIEPIANDLGHGLRLTEVVSDCERCTLQPNYPEDKLTFSAPQAGTYYLTYTVRSAEPAVGLIRIDVRADGSDTPPIAALDVAMLPPGGSVMIDPLLNDTDADGEVLVIQTITKRPELEVVLERRNLITITANAHPREPITLEYRVSDGTHSVIGHIVVIPAQTTGTMKPQPRDDSIAVRAGNTVAANVLTNDESPVGLDLKITQLTRNPFGDNAWIDGDQIRVRVPAGAQATSASIDYEMADTDDRASIATLQVEVSAEDSNEAAPQPRKIVDRVLSGTTTRIPIDLTGIDPSGSSVRLVGLASGPSLGRIVDVGEEYLTYEAYAESKGTDTFLYEVINALGMRATGQVRIGIAPPGAENTPPTGAVDEVLVRPGRHVQVAALANDFDLDGDTVAYAADAAVDFDGGIEGSILDGREIVFTAPEEPGTYTGTYDLVDGRGQLGQGTIVVTVAEDAPLLPPKTRDDTVLVSAIVGQEWVEVDVLANDYDPDGAHESLKVTLPDFSGAVGDTARVSEDGRKVIVQVLDQMQQVRYRSVDDDGNETNAVVTVPGRGDSVPVLRDQNVELEAVAGQPLAFTLDTYVVGTAGREVRLTTADNVQATQGTAAPDGPGGIRYVPDALYEGPASIVFEVTDVVSEGDTTAKTAFVSIQIKVHPAPDRPDGDDAQLANDPPHLVVENPTLTIGPGEGEERLDLTSLFKDPEGQDVYVDDLAAASGDPRVAWRADGSTLVASTAIDTPPATTRSVTGVAVDASSGQTPFTVQIVVTSSRQPLTRVANDHVPKAAAGTPVTVAALDNDVSFLSDKTLRIVDAQVISGPATIKHDAREVTVTPTSGTNGTIIARYTVQDATGDPARNVDGRITVDVQDRPARPLTPYPEGAGDGEVTVTYVSGGDGGRPVTRRIATATSPGEAPVEQDCPGERCTITGLRNGRPWSVSITEVNELGRSDPSPQSAPQTPDAKPLPPSRPTVLFGDRQLTVSWIHDRQYATALGGSPIRNYHISLLNAGGEVLGTQSVGGGVRSYTWTGLTNGTAYSFRVVAENEHKASDPSPDSTPEAPSGPPLGHQKLNVQLIENEIGGGFRVTFNTAQVNPNGAPVTSYTVTPITTAGDQPANAQTRSRVSGAVSVDITGMGSKPTRFKLTATNRSGSTVVGESDDYLVSYRIPKITHVDATPGDGSIKFNVTTTADPGAPVKIDYDIGGGWKPLGGDGVVGGLTNGQNYTVNFRASVLHLTSATYASGPHMPKAAKPRAISWNPGSMRLNAGLRVSIDVPPITTIDSGGWEVSGYTWCATTTNRCPGGVMTRSTTLDLTPGTRNRFYWTWNNEVSGHQDLGLDGVTTPRWVAESNILKFHFPYVNTGSCTITAYAGRQSTQHVVNVSNTVVHYDGAPPRVPTAGGTTDADRLDVTCQLNGASHSWRAK